MRTSKSVDFPAISREAPDRAKPEVRKLDSAVSIIDSLLREAYSARASDIHLDPGVRSFTARVRVDGLLYDVRHISPDNALVRQQKQNRPIWGGFALDTFTYQSISSFRRK